MPEPAKWKSRIVELAYMSPTEMVPNPANWRVHPQNQRGALKSVLEQVGVVMPVLYNKRTKRLIDGHLRQDLAQGEGQGEMPVIVVDVSEDEEKLILATLDPLAAMATAGDALLADLLNDVEAESEDLQEMLDELAGDTGGREVDDPGPQDDQTEELQKKWGAKLGQSWIVGSHLLFCGDCRDLAADGCDVLFFDPEWDENFKPLNGWPCDQVLAMGDGSTVGQIVGEFGPPLWLFTWDGCSSWYTPNRPLRRQKLCVWYGDIKSYNPEGSHYGEPDRPHTVKNTRGSYKYKPCRHGKHLSDVYSEPLALLHSKEGHSHSKPLTWVAMLIGNCTTGGVFDPFCGSGVSMVACEKLGRRCVAAEIDPGHCAAILERMETAYPDLDIRLDNSHA